MEAWGRLQSAFPPQRDAGQSVVYLIWTLTQGIKLTLHKFAKPRLCACVFEVGGLDS